MLAALTFLGGCASGIEAGGNFPQHGFDVNTPYDAAYRRARRIRAGLPHGARSISHGVEYRTSETLDEKFAVGRIVVFRFPN